MDDERSPFDIEPPEALRQAYIHDAIDLETFERFVGICLRGIRALPKAALPFAPKPRIQSMNTAGSILKAAWTDEPGRVIEYRPPDFPTYDPSNPFGRAALLRQRYNAERPR
jgi:hypothetical protein